MFLSIEKISTTFAALVNFYDICGEFMQSVVMNTILLFEYDCFDLYFILTYQLDC